MPRKQRAAAQAASAINASIASPLSPPKPRGKGAAAAGAGKGGRGVKGKGKASSGGADMPPSPEPAPASAVTDAEVAKFRGGEDVWLRWDDPKSLDEHDFWFQCATLTRRPNPRNPRSYPGCFLLDFEGVPCSGIFDLRKFAKRNRLRWRGVGHAVPRPQPPPPVESSSPPADAEPSDAEEELGEGQSPARGGSDGEELEPEPEPARHSRVGEEFQCVVPAGWVDVGDVGSAEQVAIGTELWCGHDARACLADQLSMQDLREYVRDALAMRSELAEEDCLRILLSCDCDCDAALAVVRDAGLGADEGLSVGLQSWTDQDRAAFKGAIYDCGKNFVSLLGRMPTKTRAQLVLYYYCEWKRDRHYPRWKQDFLGRNEDSCEMCGQGGNLLCCDGCPRAYHLGCCRPALDVNMVPNGDWYCHKCRIAGDSTPLWSRALYSPRKTAARSPTVNGAGKEGGKRQRPALGSPPRKKLAGGAPVQAASADEPSPAPKERQHGPVIDVNAAHRLEEGQRVEIKW